jgi:hypothetical protein
MDNKNITRHNNNTYADISHQEKMILQVYISLLQLDI